MNPFEPAIVRIRDAANAIHGTGFLVDDGLVCTCAHVAVEALGLPETSAHQAQPPAGEITLDFAFLGEARCAAVIEPTGWTPIRGNNGGDIAILRLTQEMPMDAAPLRLLPPGDLGGSSFSSFGFPEGADEGRTSEGKLTGPLTNGLVQVEGRAHGGVPIQGGFSGAPVWAPALGGVVGMVVAYDKAAAGVSLIVPNSEILATRSINRRTPFLATESRLGPRVFISHNAVEREALQFLDTLRRELGRHGFDVAVSPHRANDAAIWDNTLPTCIGLADACVLLLSPGALQPSALRGELALLSGRCIAGDLKHFIPVLLGLSVADVAASALSEWELPTLLAAHDPVDAQAPGAIDAVCRRLGQLRHAFRPEPALEKLESALVGKLQNVEQRALESAAVTLGIQGNATVAEATLRALVADQLWYAQPGDWQNAITGLWEQQSADRVDVARWTAPAWVDHHAARWIIEVGRSTSSRRFVVINGEDANFVSRTFIQRAYSFRPGDYVVITDLCDDTALPGVHVATIRSNLKQELFGNSNYDDHSFDVRLPEELEQTRTFVVLPGPVPDDELMRQLRTEFPPGLAFVIVTPTNGEVKAQDDHLVTVRPPVEADQEWRASRALKKLDPT